MASRALPGLGLTGFYNSGEDGWGDQLSQDIRKASVTIQLKALSQTTSLPGSPVQGDIYIVPSGDANANKVAVYDDSAWVYFTPQQGWIAYILDTGAYRYWNGASWALLIPAEGVTPGAADISYAGATGDPTNVQDALSALFAATGSGGLTVSEATDDYIAVLGDANSVYKKMNKATPVVYTIPDQATVAWGEGATLTLEQTGAGAVTVAPGSSSVVLNSRGGLLDSAGQFAVVTAIRTGVDEWTITGDIA